MNLVSLTAMGVLGIVAGLATGAITTTFRENSHRSWPLAGVAMAAVVGVMVVAVTAAVTG